MNIFWLEKVWVATIGFDFFLKIKILFDFVIKFLNIVGLDRS